MLQNRYEYEVELVEKSAVVASALVVVRELDDEVHHEIANTWTLSAWSLARHNLRRMYPDIGREEGPSTWS